MTSFKDVEFMTAKDKELTLKQWRTFLKGGMQEKHFTDRIYKHLILHCSFIAHYSKSGFYGTYFTVPEDTIRFVSQFDPNGDQRSIEMGGQWWMGEDYKDINEAMCQVVGEYIDYYVKINREEIRKRDIAKAKGLLKKHGVQSI